MTTTITIGSKVCMKDDPKFKGVVVEIDGDGDTAGAWVEWKRLPGATPSQWDSSWASLSDLIWMGN